MSFKMFDDNRILYQNYVDRLTRIDSSHICFSLKSTDSIIKTDFEYQIGSEEYQNLFISHKQNLSDLDIIQLQIDKLKLGSVYRNNAFSRDNVGIGYYHMDSTNFSFAGKLIYSNVARQNNWGIDIDTGLFNNNVNRSFYNVKSTSSSNSVELIDFESEFFFPGLIQFGGEAGVSRYIQRYDDLAVGGSEQYEEIFIDSNITSDEFKEGNERIALGIKTYFGLELKFMSGLMRSYYRNFGNDTAKIVPYSFLEIADTVAGWDLSLISTYKDGVFINASWSYGINSKLRSKFKTHLNLISGSQSEFYSNYSSNHVMISNGVKNTTRWDGWLRYQLGKNINIGLRHFGVLNPYMYNPDSNTVEQYQSVNHISQGYSKIKIIENANHELGVSFSYTLLQGDYYSHPDIIGQIDYRFSTSFFKEKLPITFAISPKYVGRYKLMSYQPNINMVYYDGFSIQPDNYYVDVNIIAKIAGIDLNLGVLHLNQGLSDKHYYDFTGMPGLDRLITFGLSVYFNN